MIVWLLAAEEFLRAQTERRNSRTRLGTFGSSNVFSFSTLFVLAAVLDTSLPSQHLNTGLHLRLLSSVVGHLRLELQL